LRSQVDVQCSCPRLTGVVHVQRGDGEYIPHVLVHRGGEKAGLPSGLSVEFVQYLPSMHAYMEAADLIISHAGSGSLFEALSLGKTIIAVPNATLMANHQVRDPICIALAVMLALAACLRP
jgi:UDP-N-acetylglucosamine transferase subunit ALG13